MTRSERIPYLISYTLSFVLFAAALVAFFQGQWFNAFLAGLAFALTYLPALLQKNLKIILPLEFELIMVLFIFSALYLGEVQSYYVTFWWWDLLLHTSSGFILGFIGFVLIYVMNSQENIPLKLSPLFVGVFSFLFSVSLGTIWEIFEFSADIFLQTNMQKSGLMDTMGDMIVNLLGAFVMSFLGALYIWKGRTHLINGLLVSLINKNPRLFRKK